MSLSTVAHETFVIERSTTFRSRRLSGMAIPCSRPAGLPVLLKSWSCYELDIRVGP